MHCPDCGEPLHEFSFVGNDKSRRCVRCGRWWFPTDSLLRYKPAQEAKVNYYRQWGKAADVGSLALPALVLLIVLAGVATGVSLVKRNTGGRVAAQATVRNLAAADGGSGEMWIVWSSAAGYKVKWRRVGEPEWRGGGPGGKEEGGGGLEIRGVGEGGG